jgi:hypothetical protein
MMGFQGTPAGPNGARDEFLLAATAQNLGASPA